MPLTAATYPAPQGRWRDGTSTVTADTVQHGNSLEGPQNAELNPVLKNALYGIKNIL